MAFTKGEYAATFLTFVALLLEIFVLVSGTANKPVLRDLYFARLEYQGKFTNMGLWGSCYGSNGQFDQCSVPSAPFKWPDAEGVDIKVNVDLPNSIYLAILILYWIAFLASALAMQVTVFTYFKRLPSFFAAVSSLMATGALFIIWIIVVVAAAKFKSAAEAVGAQGSMGNSCWMVLGAMIASFLATAFYSFICVCRRNKTTQDTFKY